MTTQRKMDDTAILSQALVYAEWGYKACERGWNLQYALDELMEQILRIQEDARQVRG